MSVKNEKSIEIKKIGHGKYFLLTCFFCLFFSYGSFSQKMYRDAKKVKDTSHTPFIILKTGEKISVKKVNTDYYDILRDIVYFDDKKIDERDIVAFQNSKGYFKKFPELKPKVGAIKSCYFVSGRESGYFDNRFFLRHKKGVINVYGQVVGSPNYNDWKNTFTYNLNIFEKDSTKEIVMGSSYCYDTDKDMEIVEGWISGCAKAKKLVADCKGANNFKISRKLSQYPILEGVDLYNKEFKKAL